MDKLMELLTSEYALNFWIPLVIFIIGVFTLIKPPKYKSTRGFATKQAMKNEKVWFYVHKVFGLLCIAFTFILALTAWITMSLIGGTAGFVVQIIIEVAAIALMVPIVNYFTDKKFDWNR